MQKNKFEGGDLGEGQADNRFKITARTEAEVDAAEVLGQEAGESLTEREGRALFGGRFFGGREIKKVFGQSPEYIPPIPFTRGELRRANDREEFLVYYPESLPNGKGEEWDLSLRNLLSFAYPALGGMSRQEMNRAWFSNAKFFSQDVPRAGWRLVKTGKEPETPSSSFISEVKNYFDQTEELATLLHEEDGKDGRPLRAEYQEALAEFEAKRGLIHSRITAKGKDAVELLVGLKINRLMRERPVEVVYRELLCIGAGKKGLLPAGRRTVSTNEAIHGEILVVRRDSSAFFSIDTRDIESQAMTPASLYALQGVYD